MSKRMSERNIADIVAVADKEGFFAQMKDNGDRRYVKNLKLVSGRLPSALYVHLDTGVQQGYLKVAIHPDHWSEAVLAPEHGIRALMNSRKGKNPAFFGSSNWDEFPCRSGYKSPLGRCYRVEIPGGNLDALRRLLRGLVASAATA
jgi:hypothetical protein